MSILCTKNDSGNSKLGNGVRATYRQVGPTCPNECSLLNNGCYAQKGLVKMHQSGAEPSDNDADEILSYLKDLPGGKKIRHHVSGDFFKDNKPDRDYIGAILQGHLERPDLEGWSYTHGWERLEAEQLNCAESLTVNASTDNLEQAKKAKREGWPVTTVVESDAPKNQTLDSGEKVVVCPSQTDDVPCSECKLCMQKNRECIVAFRKH